MIWGPLIIDFSTERGQERLCSGQELCGQNSWGEYNVFMVREKPNFWDGSEPRPCSELSRPAEPLVLLSIWMGMIQAGWIPWILARGF